MPASEALANDIGTGVELVRYIERRAQLCKSTDAHAAYIYRGFRLCTEICTGLKCPISPPKLCF